MLLLCLLRETRLAASPTVRHQSLQSELHYPVTSTNCLQSLSLPQYFYGFLSVDQAYQQG